MCHLCKNANCTKSKHKKQLKTPEKEPNLNKDQTEEELNQKANRIADQQLSSPTLKTIMTTTSTLLVLSSICTTFAVQETPRLEREEQWGETTKQGLSRKMKIREILNNLEPEYFLTELMMWMKGKNVFIEEGCMILNFGFYGDLQYPQLFLTSSNNLSLNLGTHGMNAPNTCSIVLVAGLELEDLSNVMSRVDSLGQDMQKIPYAVVLLVDNQNINLTTSRHAMSPPVVQVDLKTDTPLNLSRTIFSYTCYGEADSQATKLLLRLGKVNRPAEELCKQTVRMAYTNYGSFGIRTNIYGEEVMVIDNSMKVIQGATHSDILSSFFSSKKLTPTWENANYDSGWFVETTGRWTGVVGLVSCRTC